MTDNPTNEAAAAYEATAAIYDDFTAHHDYELYLSNLLPAIERHRTHGRRLLDVGCGTGKSLLPMVKRGWSICACDIAPSMLKLAKAKAARLDEVELRVADMRTLPVFGEFDLVWSLDDAMNHLLTLAELESSIRRMAANLSQDGLLVFDLNTLLSFRTFFAEDFVVERNGLRMTWKGQANPEGPPGMIAEASLSVKPLVRSPEKKAIAASAGALHRERHFPEVAVLDTLSRCGMRVLDVFGHHYDAVLQQPLDEGRHTKAVYLATRS